MAGTYFYFYFDLDFYGVGFYEEEIGSAFEQAAAAEPEVFYPLGGGEDSLDAYDGYLSPEDDLHHYEKMSSTEESPRESVGQPIAKNIRKLHRFTPGQLWELRKVFEETQYPDIHRRRKLAEVMNLDECKVKYWFNNTRAKRKKTERASLRRGNSTGTQENSSTSILVEPKSVIFLKEQVADGFIWCQQLYHPHCL